MSPRFLCRVTEEGHLVPVHPERLIRRRGKECWVSVHDQPAIGIRSDASLRYQWGVVYRTIADETGNDPETIHRALKQMAVDAGILEPVYDLIGTALAPTGDPTTVVDQDTHSRYLTWVRHEAEHGRFGAPFHIPEPGE